MSRYCSRGGDRDGCSGDMDERCSDSGSGQLWRLAVPDVLVSGCPCIHCSMQSSFQAIACDEAEVNEILSKRRDECVA